MICGSVWSSGQIFGTFPVTDDMMKLRALPEKTADEDPREMIGTCAAWLVEVITAAYSEEPPKQGFVSRAPRPMARRLQSTI